MLIINLLSITGAVSDSPRLYAMIFSIIGIVNASKVKSSTSEFEAQHRKSTATVMLILGLIVLFAGILVYIVLKLLKVVAENIFEGIFGF